MHVILRIKTEISKCSHLVFMSQVHILDEFAKLRKTTISFVTSVHLSAWNNSVHTRRIFVKFDI